MVEEQLEDWIAKGWPWVVFRKPGEQQLIAYFQQDDKTHRSESLDVTGFVMAPFTGTPIIIPAQQSHRVTQPWQPTEATATATAPPTEQGRSAFESLVQRGIQAINEDAFRKVVLSRTETVDWPNFEFKRAFDLLASTYPNAFVYGFFHADTGLWMGATPERLVQVQNSEFRTMALAGTQRFDGSDRVDWGAKEREEQQIVTDFIVENLEMIATDIAFSDPFTHQAGNLLHLRTDISGPFEGGALQDVVTALHPTPAVCGMPRQQALDFILTHEGYDRRFYSGYLGEIQRDGADLYVNLRCMEIEAGKAKLYVGCGITRDSNPQKEYEETVQKTLTLKKIIEA